MTGHENPPELEHERSALREVGLALHGEIAAGFDRIEAEISIVGGVSTGRKRLCRPDGTCDSVMGKRDSTLRARELREAMYRPGAGTWFTAWFAVTAEGNLRTRFDHDAEPELGQFGAEAYRADFDEFPRTPENTPDWLAAVLAGAPTRHDLVRLGHDDGR
ncbi:hypothetical protein [Frigoribacterium sp. PhB24]|uniref:hypothetical protein n=1 Tax=Frigoribacterium sp. PhB24 TaxID=2485204 RepID=UPI000F48202E|nr:hypothetical protein [Frigoribacterium sp. PhB24]ROS49597.1 hypothetical protein EDF50_2516 [Frigoribacterium sp. PhB24]